LRYSFFVAAESNQSRSYAASLGLLPKDGSRWGFLLGLTSLLITSLLFRVAFVDVKEDVCDAFESDYGDDNDDKKLIDDRPDAVDAVDGEDPNAGSFCNCQRRQFYFSATKRNLLFRFFSGVTNIDSLAALDMV
jgi:hypothetical protein